MGSRGEDDQYCEGQAFFESEEEELQGQAEIWKHTFAFVDSLLVRCAILLGIPDAIAAEEGPISLPQIAARLARAPDAHVDVGCLFRIMRLLAAKNVFSASQNANGETVYALTAASKWLLKAKMSPFLLLQSDPANTAPWHHLHECVLGGGMAFERAHGTDVWSYASAHPAYNRLFNGAMACRTQITMKGLLSKHPALFQSLRSMVDVGGGTGTAIAEIVGAFPQIRGINFDLPHVVATAPNLAGVEHIGGDMLASVPSAEAVFIKSILHNWNDEDCIRILRSCRKAIPPQNGKIIIVGAILEDEEEEEEEKKKNAKSEIRLALDLVMMVVTCGGKERTKAEWAKILSASGFHRYNVLELPDLYSIIEAFPSQH